MRPALWDDQKYNLCRIYAGNNVRSKSIVLHLIGHVWTLDWSDIGHGLLAVSSSQDRALGFLCPWVGHTWHHRQVWWHYWHQSQGPGDDEICVCITLTFYLSIYQECGKYFELAVKNYLTIASLDHLSLFIRRNSKQCDISGRSDHLITDTFLHAGQIFFGIGLGCFYRAQWVSRGEVTPNAKKSMLEFFEPIINYINPWVTGGWEPQRFGIHLPSRLMVMVRA